MAELYEVIVFVFEELPTISNSWRKENRREKKVNLVQREKSGSSSSLLSPVNACVI